MLDLNGFGTATVIIMAAGALAYLLFRHFLAACGLVLVVGLVVFVVSAVAPDVADAADALWLALKIAGVLLAVAIVFVVVCLIVYARRGDGDTGQSSGTDQADSE